MDEVLICRIYRLLKGVRDAGIILRQYGCTMSLSAAKGGGQCTTDVMDEVFMCRIYRQLKGVRGVGIILRQYGCTMHLSAAKAEYEPLT